MKWWVETFLRNLQDLNTLWVLAKTNYADHLFMTWDFVHPAREPILVLIRGVHKQCGYKYIWDTPHIEEQDTAGDTQIHQFHLLNLPTPCHIWYYLWSPEGPYGLEIQSPLHRADLSYLPPPECAPFYTFDTDFQTWWVEMGSAQWVNEGSPNPGSIQEFGPVQTRVRSPAFDSSWASTIIIELELKHLEDYYQSFILVMLKAGLWHTLKSWNLKATPWTHYTITGAEAYKSASTQLRMQKVAGGTFTFDTICVRLYP